MGIPGHRVVLGGVVWLCLLLSGHIFSVAWDWLDVVFEEFQPRRRRDIVPLVSTLAFPTDDLEPRFGKSGKGLFKSPSRLRLGMPFRKPVTTGRSHLSNEGSGGSARVSADHTICLIMTLNLHRTSFNHGRVLGSLLRRKRWLGCVTGRSVC
jgi:hypothetical protein